MRKLEVLGKQCYSIAYLAKTKQNKCEEEDEKEDIIKPAFSDDRQGGFQFIDHDAKQTNAGQVNVKLMLPNYQ